MANLNRKKRLTIVAIGIAIVGSPAIAQGPGWTEVSVVKELVNTYNGGFNVRLSPELTGCASQSGYGEAYASVYPQQPGIAQMKADLLAAMLTGAKVALYLSDNTCKVVETRLYGD